ncbi:hypothetical protein ID866_12001 [Astraeus odoratus]|nr:hypothetical protein ID866_12001 [Astraeus odoratus]
MSMHKSSTITGALAKKIVNWTKVLDEELATDIDDTDSAEEAEKCWKEEERQQKEAEAEQKWKDEERKRGASTAAEARKRQRVCKTGAFMPHTNGGQEMFSVRVVREGQGMLAGTSPRGGECKKRVKKVADEDEDEDDKIIVLSGWKTKWQGGGEMLEEITDRQWGELIQAVSSHMDVANSHLEKIASAVQSNGHKVQWHHLLMEGLVGQQQVLLSKLVEMAGAAGSGGAKGTTEGQEEPKEPQGEESGGQDGKTEGAPGEGLGDGTGGGGPESKAKDKGKGKEKAL